MVPRFSAFAFAAALLAAATLARPALADSESWVHPPGELPQHGDQSHDLNFLFGALKVAPDEDTATAIEQRIWARWLVSSSDTTNLLMSRVKAAVDAKDIDLAIKLLNAVVELNPTYVEGWNRRATLYYMKKDYLNSLADIRRVLALEPRHFGALTGMGLILQELGDEKHALEAFRKAVAIDPHLQRIPDLVKTLTEKIEGRDI